MGGDGGQHYYFGGGDHVTMHGGSGNTGIDKRVAPPAELPPEARQALHELLLLAERLRTQVPPVSAAALDDTLPVLSPGANVPPQERHRALLAVAGIAATVGTVGAPVVEAINKVLQLLGAT